METERTKRNYNSRMTAGNVQDDRVSKQLYVPNDGQEFWGQNSITKHILLT